ncbi:uncharacterized protein BDR25DRAFT_361682 [Lindgomyces ingoldianus]|uniref:Uncharacterized protein n=1 Tax=Lindgomyces ingoldianus TaxID=673940 RepID=A0ACB6QE36_9PLEO|nr:uncharacterized protein BDR25DRAFT_361682 [Lindgomyces ingoldianus]KAF2464406.1 hypothetical protein BDR25DRAFT_361682 [Lindgomyces ingoldianus]
MDNVVSRWDGGWGDVVGESHGEVVRPLRYFENSNRLATGGGSTHVDAGHSHSHTTPHGPAPHILANNHVLMHDCLHCTWFHRTITMDNEEPLVRAVLIPLSASAIVTVREHHRRNAISSQLASPLPQTLHTHDVSSISLYQDRHTHRFVIGSDPSSHVRLQELGKDQDYINLHHAIIYPDPDNHHVEVHNVSGSTSFRAWSVESRDIMHTILPGDHFRLACGNWRLQISKALAFEVRLPSSMEQFNALVEPSLHDPAPSPRRSLRLRQITKLSTENTSCASRASTSRADKKLTAKGKASSRGRAQGYHHPRPESEVNTKTPELTPRKAAGKSAAPRHITLPSPPELTWNPPSRPKAPVLHETVGETVRTIVHRGKRDGIVTAVKTARRPSAESTAREWRNECDILSKLQHPHVVSLVYYDARDLRLELEYVGPDLAKGVDEAGMSTLSQEVQYRVWHDISSALQYIHGEGISHCDIKPQNILLGDNGKKAILCDFGQATRTGVVHSGGTPRFIAPEYVTGGIRGHPGDIWAFGITMLFVLALISLPEEMGWAIYRLAEDERVREEMSSWIRHIKAIEIPPRYALVTRMLEERRRKRITATDLVQEPWEDDRTGISYTANYSERLGAATTLIGPCCILEDLVGSKWKPSSCTWLIHGHRHRSLDSKDRRMAKSLPLSKLTPRLFGTAALDPGYGNVLKTLISIGRSGIVQTPIPPHDIIAMRPPLVYSNSLPTNFIPSSGKPTFHSRSEEGRNGTMYNNASLARLSQLPQLLIPLSAETQLLGRRAAKVSTTAHTHPTSPPIACVVGLAWLKFSSTVLQLNWSLGSVGSGSGRILSGGRATAVPPAVEESAKRLRSGRMQDSEPPSLVVSLKTKVHLQPRTHIPPNNPPVLFTDRYGPNLSEDELGMPHHDTMTPRTAPQKVYYGSCPPTAAVPPTNSVPNVDSRDASVLDRTAVQARLSHSSIWRLRVYFSPLVVGVRDSDTVKEGPSPVSSRNGVAAKILRDECGFVNLLVYISIVPQEFLIGYHRLIPYYWCFFWIIVESTLFHEASKTLQTKRRKRNIRPIEPGSRRQGGPITNDFQETFFFFSKDVQYHLRQMISFSIVITELSNLLHLLAFFYFHDLILGAPMLYFRNNLCAPKKLHSSTHSIQLSTM